jgi:pimeloyl-ACP methyl ester carboxylesterase
MRASVSKLLIFSIFSALVSCASIPKNQFSELEALDIGGISQSLLYRGDVSKPILLILHGGGLPLPGIASKNRYSELNKNFLVVFWDQRGTGLATSELLNKSNMKLENYVADVVDITKHLKQRFHREKIILLGHSWGSIIGLEVISKHPDDYLAYIGISQQISVNESDTLVYRELIERSKLAHSPKADHGDLSQLGEPPYKTVEEWLILREIVAKSGGLVSGKGDIGMLGMIKKMVGPFIWNFDYPWFETFRINGNMNFTMNNIYDEMMAVDFTNLNSIEIPTIFIHGVHDLNSHPLPFQKWFNNLKSPHKKYIQFKKSAHMPMWEEKSKFQSEIIEYIKISENLQIKADKK